MLEPVMCLCSKKNKQTGFVLGEDEFKIVAANAMLPFTLNQSGYTYASGWEWPCVERLKKWMFMNYDNT